MTREKSSDIDRSVKAVKRTLSILDAFIAHPGGLTLGQIEAASGLFKSVILRYMLTLEAEHYVFKRADGCYELGSRAYQLGASYERTFNLHVHIAPVLKKLTAATQESSTFYVRDGDFRMCLLRKDSPHHIKSSVPVGTMLPMDDTSAAAILRDFENGMPPNWDYRDGIYTSTGAGLNRKLVASLMTASISTPVFKHEGKLVGALSISGPTSRFDPEDSASQTLIRDAAEALSRMLGA